MDQVFPFLYRHQQKKFKSDTKDNRSHLQKATLEVTLQMAKKNVKPMD